MAKADALLERIEAFHLVKGEVVVRKVGRGYSLFSARTGAAIARLRPTGEADMVQVLWWSGERWGASGARTWSERPGGHHLMTNVIPVPVAG